MSRRVPEWIGKTDDSAVPDRVRLRVLRKHGDRCYLCTRQIRIGEYWEADHVVAIVNGGANRETNLAPACSNCCRPKTANDLAEKSKTYAMASKAYLPRTKSRGFQSKYRRKMDGTVVLR